MHKPLSERIFDIINVIIMLFLMFVTIYPLWYVFCGSLSNGTALLSHTGPLFWFKNFDTSAYMAVMENNMVKTGFSNVLFILVVGVSLNIIMSSIGAYVLSRKDVFWNTFFMKMITISMFFSGGLIPGYLLVAKTLHMNNSLWALIIPGVINTHNLIIMRASFAGIPDSLIESAQLDGASHATILSRIIFPLSKSILAVMTLYYAVGHWNSWFSASIYLTDRGKYPLQLVLREILIQNSSTELASGTDNTDKYYIGETIKYATIIVSTIPILVVYPFLQRYFVKGVMVGAVKG